MSDTAKVDYASFNREQNRHIFHIVGAALVAVVATAAVCGSTFLYRQAQDSEKRDCRSEIAAEERSAQSRVFIDAVDVLTTGVDPTELQQSVRDLERALEVSAKTNTPEDPCR